MTKTVVLFDPVTGFEALDVDDTLETYHQLIRCQTLAGSTCSVHTVYVDDDALLRDPVPPVSVIDRTGRALIFGRIVFVGYPDRDGDTHSLSEIEVKHIVNQRVFEYVRDGRMYKAIVDTYR